MIVGSLVLILSAAVLLAVGLVMGYDPLLGASIVASLIAAVMLYIGARQSSATRAERRSADDWEAEQPVDEYDRRDDYPTEPVPSGYSEPGPGRYEAAPGPPEEQRFPEPGRFHGDERYDAPERVAEQRYEPAEQPYERAEQGYEPTEQPPGEERYDAAEQPAQSADRFADLRHYEENAFSDPHTAVYDRGAGYPEPPVAERMWTPPPGDRVPAQRDANGAGDDESGYAGQPPLSEGPSSVPPGHASESGAHAAPEPAGVGTEHEPASAHAESGPMTAEARRLEQLPPDEWIGGGVDDEDPKDEPPIQRRTVQVAAAVAQMATDVFVIDGRPRYHVPGCVHLLGRESEPLPAEEAVDLGFTPCSLCEPDTVLVSGAAEKARR